MYLSQFNGLRCTEPDCHIRESTDGTLALGDSCHGPRPYKAAIDSERQSGAPRD